jgi:hypothetical protein
MATTASALSDQAQSLRPYLKLVLRDDLVAWHANTNGPFRSDLEQRQTEVHEERGSEKGAGGGV